LGIDHQHAHAFFSGTANAKNEDFTTRFARGTEVTGGSLFLTCRETTASQKQSAFGKWET
jgi:hypothetical protein